MTLSNDIMEKFESLGIDDIDYIPICSAQKITTDDQLYEDKCRKELEEQTGEEICKTMLFRNEFDGSNLRRSKQKGGILLEAKYTKPDTTEPVVQQIVVSFVKMLGVRIRHQEPIRFIIMFSEEKTLDRFSDFIITYYLPVDFEDSSRDSSLELWHYNPITMKQSSLVKSFPL